MTEEIPKSTPRPNRGLTTKLLAEIFSGDGNRWSIDQIRPVQIMKTTAGGTFNLSLSIVLNFS
jgi:hypothetical protein